jgi:hypothetical protein
MDWHDEFCTRLDLTTFDLGTSCLSCGSFGPALDPTRPPIKHLSEIRILRILPGDFNDAVECEVFTAGLSSYPEYDAISYTWADESGDASRCCSILVSGKSFEVTRNCEMVLRRVRMQFSSRQIWIDAICIDQDNIDERGHQVRLMPRIYSGAKTVLIYVGESTPNSSLVLRSLSRHDSDVDLNSQFWLHWREVFARRYFNRVWILQEVALSRKATLICGEDSVAWSIMQTSEMKKSFSKIKGLPPVLFFDYRTYASPDQFLNLLILACQCESTDPRDKVFALLGLLPAGRFGKIEADYTSSFEQIYIRVALDLKDTFGWDAVLSLAGLLRRASSFPHAQHVQQEQVSLPSWVPDWRVSNKMELPDLEQGTQILPRGAGHPKTTIWTPDIEYNEQEGSITFKLLEVPGSGARWNGWDANISALCSRYICLQDPGRLHWIARKAYRHLCDNSDPRILWDSPNMPYGSFSTWNVHLDLKLHSTPKHVLLEFMPPDLKIRWGCFSFATAVQIFTLPVLNMEFCDVIKALKIELAPRPIMEAKLPEELEQQSLYTPVVVDSELMESHILDDSFTTDAIIADIKEMRDDLQPVEEELEGLWMRKWDSSELVMVPSFDLMPGIETSEFIEANDSLWKLLVRAFLMKETTVKLV